MFENQKSFWVTARSTLFTLARFPVEHPKAFGILFLAMSGNAINSVHTKDNNDWQQHFSLEYGDYNNADIAIYAENHLFHAETWNAVDAWNASVVLVEGVPSGKVIPCEDRMDEPHVNSPGFNPVCIGWDTDNPAFYKRNIDQRVLSLIRQVFHQCQRIESMIGINKIVFQKIIREVREPFLNDLKVLNKDKTFTRVYLGLDEPVKYSFNELKFIYKYIFNEYLREMSYEYLSSPKTLDQLQDEAVSRFSQSSVLWDKDEMLARNIALVKTIETYTKPGQKTAVIAGTSHVISYYFFGMDLHPETAHAVQYLQDFINTPEMTNRVAVLGTVHDGFQGSFYLTKEDQELLEQLVLIENEPQPSTIRNGMGRRN